MSNSLITGVTGLNSHQKMLEVIGNNLANLNTTGFKSRRVLFGDLVYESLAAPTGSVSGVQGGTNPSQVGSGVRVSQVDVQFTQGNLEQTGNSFDYAIEGNGFFVVNNGQRDLFTRAGAFSVDDGGFLIDPATGNYVQRLGTVGEPDGTGPAFQVPGDASIRIPFGASIPGQATTAVDLVGNLNSSATGPQAQTLTSFAGWTAGSAPATASTLLNNLDASAAPYAAGDVIDIAGTDADGAPVGVTLSVDATTTLGDLVAAIDTAYAGATATVDAAGRIQLTADDTGESLLSLTLSDAAGNAGSLAFSSNPQVESIQGKEGDVVPSAIQVYDSHGLAHTVHVRLQKQVDGSWNLTAEMDAADGTLLDASVEQIRFNEDGSFLQVDGDGVGDPALTVQFAGSATPQVITLGFGDAGEFDGMTELALESYLAAGQDGSPPGTLVSAQVRGDGTIEGITSNGRTLTLAQLAMASFRNPDGLLARGANLFEASLASGEVQLGTALSGGRGAVRAGQLESSNIDIALEFTRLIVAQRGFSANARTITVSDQVLEELTNLIR